MSGQYKIRSNSQDNFDDIKRSYKIARRGGGCWENTKSCLGLIVLLTICGVIFSVLSGTSSAQSSSGSDDSCFPHKTLYTTQTVETRKDDTYLARWVGETASRKMYTVYETRQAALFGSCWIRISEGWLLRRANSSVIRPGTASSTSSTRSATSTTTSSGCYASKTAYITGNMNIRQAANVNSTKVGLATSGQQFAVSRSWQKEDYCWLKINKGWIAKTGRVKPAKPTTVRTATTATTRSTSRTSCANMPSIHADSSGRIKRAMDYLCINGASWYDYVIAKTSTIKANLGIQGGRAYVKRRHVEINDSWYPNTMELASVIVHEACHIYQWEQGRYNSLNPTAREVECINKQIDFVSQVAPGSRWLDILRDYVKNPRVGYGG